MRFTVVQYWASTASPDPVLYDVAFYLVVEGRPVPEEAALMGLE